MVKRNLEAKCAEERRAKAKGKAARKGKGSKGNVHSGLMINTNSRELAPAHPKRASAAHPGAAGKRHPSAGLSLSSAARQDRLPPDEKDAAKDASVIFDVAEDAPNYFSFVNPQHADGGDALDAFNLRNALHSQLLGRIQSVLPRTCPNCLTVRYAPWAVQFQPRWGSTRFR